MKGRSSLLPVGAVGTYRVGLFASSTLAHCGRCALTVPSTWMTPPSVITPRSTNKLKRAKQLSGTASASNNGAARKAHERDKRAKETRLRGWACKTRSAPGDRQGVGGASPLR